MPFVSQAEVGWMASNKPALFKRWKAKYGIPKGLPKRLHKKLMYKGKKRGG